MHSQSNSDASSIPLSLPEDNRRPLYFVQSPSRHSQQEDKIGSSYESTPALSSLMASPQPSQSYHGIDHSRHSSESRISDMVKRGSRKTTLKRVPRNWQEFDTVDEGEGLIREDEESRKGKSIGWYVMMFIAGFIVLFTLFSLILCGVSNHQYPEIIVQSITFYRFSLQAGTDDTGVLTDMITVNSSLMFTFQNRGTFFGLHVSSSTPLTLFYTQFVIGTGDIQEFFQERHSARNISVLVIGDQIPLYGNGAPLVTPKGLTTGRVPLQLSITVRSRARVLGDLVKTTFIKKIDCSVDFSSGKFDVAIPLTNSCT